MLLESKAIWRRGQSITRRLLAAIVDGMSVCWPHSTALDLPLRYALHRTVQWHATLMLQYGIGCVFSIISHPLIARL